jgi:hypothetical protein
MPNTQENYYFDFNATGYYPRRYLVSTKGYETDYNLNSYLAAVVDGAFQSVIFTRILTNESIPGVKIVAKKNLPGLGLTTVEERITDSAGSGTFSFLSGEDYFLDFHYNNVLYWGNALLNPVYSTYQAYINLQKFEFPDTNATVFSVDFFPAKDYIDSNSFVDLNVFTALDGAEVDNINILVYFDTNTLYDANISSLGLHEISNLGIANSPAYLPLTVEVVLLTTDGQTISRKKSYQLNLSVQQRSFIGSLENIAGTFNLGRNSHHKEVTTLIAIFLIIFFIAPLAGKAGFGSTGAGVITMLVLGLGVVIGMVMYEAFIATVIVFAALVMLERRF